MAEFTEQDQEFLETLRKAYEKAASTDAARDPWQELFSRDTSVEASRSVLAADIVKGFSGSWAASFQYGRGISPKDDQAPTPLRRTTSKLGRRGIPDIDFVPYNWRTNRFGSKGPSLVGHPISFEVVGPTLKSPACDWIWVINPGGGPNGGDTLTMGPRFDAGIPTCTTVVDAYEVSNFLMGDPNEPNGGLYLIVSDVGVEPGSMPLGAGSQVLEPFIESFPFEIFRVASVDGATIELHPNKRITDFIEPNGDFALRAITLLTPYVTKLVAVPNSGAGVGREQTFLVVSPERAAASDLYPPLDGGTLGDGTWAQGGFPGGGTGTGSSGTYGGKNRLPIPKPINEGSAQLRQNLVPAPEPVGFWDLVNSTVPSSDVADRVLNIFDVRLVDGVPREFGPQALGWYPVVELAGPSGFILQRVAEVDPTTGFPFFGPGPVITFPLPLTVRCSFTVHNAVSTLWEGAFKADDVDSARLTNLIDPRYVERLEKQISETVPDPTFAPAGANAGRGDRAIFNTKQQGNPAGLNFADNPGSLLDLGFRMVLFPAKAGLAGEPIPDFDRPIYSREVVIDGSLDPSVKQFIDIDYSAGLVRLSVPPPELGGGGLPVASTEINPAGNPGPIENARREVILFAACVPFSMEEGQLGTGTRVTTTLPDSEQDVDVFSDEVFAYVNPDLATVDPVLPGFPNGIPLDRIWEGPPTGVIEIFAGGPTRPSYGTWQYNTTDETEVVSEGVTRRYTTLLGVQSRPSNTPVLPFIPPSDSYYVRLRREAQVQQDAGDPNELADRAVDDSTYGASARPTAMRIKDFKSKYELDGSLTFEEVRQAQRWQQGGMVAPAFYTEVVDDGGLTQKDRFIRPDGVFASPNRYDEFGLTFDEVVEPGFRLDGNTATFRLPNATDLRATRFSTPTVFGANNYRLVVKFDYDAEEPANNMINFIGLLSPITSPANPQGVALATPPLLATDVYVGLRFEGDPKVVTDQWQLLVSSGTGPSIVAAVPRLNPRDPYYLAIESEREGYVDPDSTTLQEPYRLKVAVLDQNLQPVFEREFPAGTPALPQTISSLFLGTRSTAQLGDLYLRIYYVSYVTRKDLPGPKI